MKHLDKNKVRVGMILYTEEEWKKYKAAAEDDDGLNTYHEWIEKRNELRTIFKSRGIEIVDLEIKFSELENWLKARNLRNTSENRAHFVSWFMVKGFYRQQMGVIEITAHSVFIPNTWI